MPKRWRKTWQKRAANEKPTPGPGFDVEWLPKVQGTLRKTFPFAPEAGRDADGYAWYELGEYDISALQKIHHPTMHRLSLYIEGDVEIERIEIAKVK